MREHVLPCKPIRRSHAWSLALLCGLWCLGGAAATGPVPTPHTLGRQDSTDNPALKQSSWWAAVLENLAKGGYHLKSDGQTLPAWSWIADGDQASAYLGSAVSSAGDVNGDGYNDVVVGASYYDDGETDEGQALVFYGSASGLSASPAWTAEGGQEYAYFGAAVASAGDVNGDGYDDVIVGAAYYDNGETDEGRTFVYHGSASGLSFTPNWTAEGGQEYAYFGASVSSAGDVNGDGYDDVIVGATYYDDGEEDEGAAFVYFGSAAGLSATPSWSAESDQGYAYLGSSVSSAGDVNGDGYDDVIVGSAYYDGGETDEGATFVHLGSATGPSAAPDAVIEGDQAYAYSGASVSDAGDVNGDGYDDVIIGSAYYDNGETDEGLAALHLGSPTGISATPAWTAESGQAYGYLGASVSSAGDLNGDGFGDVIVGATNFDAGHTDEGAAFVYHGSAAGLSAEPVWMTESDQAYAYLGASVSPAGDVDGDGTDDVIIGAAYFDAGERNEGRAFVYRGSHSGLSATPGWSAESGQDYAYLGLSVSSAGDVNGDGYGDVVVSAPSYDNDETDEGLALVYLGSAAGLSTWAVWAAEGDQEEAYFGGVVTGAGDVNGDGYDDVVICSAYYDNGQIDEGRAFLYHGSASGLSDTPAWTAEGDQEYAYFGAAASTAGDVNGDGYDDVVVTSTYYDNGQTDEGRAFVYLGSASGLGAAPAWTAESNQEYAYFGAAASAAGDVNGDGYDDVVVTATFYDNGQTDEGRAFVYLGSASGLGASPAWTAESDQEYAYFGASASGAGDVNADGYDDVIVSATYYDNDQTDEGRVAVYLGSASGLSASPAWTAEGNQEEAYLGVSTAGAGDVNRDGYDDIIIGSYFDNGETDEGRAVVYFGSASGLPTSPDWIVEGDQESAYLGASVSSAGDVNGDGYADVIVGAPSYDRGGTDEGYAFVYLGYQGGLTPAEPWAGESDQSYTYFGASVSSAGDVNGDGYADVVVGAPYYDGGELDEGAAFVFLGSASGLAATPAWTAQGDQESAYFGSSVACAGDVNGDGYDDVLVGTPNHDGNETDGGRACLYLGSASGLAATPDWTAQGDQEEAYFGLAVAGAGDVDNDGYDDVLVSATYYDSGQTDEGRVYLYSGASWGLWDTPAWATEGNQESAFYGAAVSGAGDVNGDGYSDVIISATSYDGGETDEGRAFIYLGSSSGLGGASAWTTEGDQEYAYYGASVSSAGDVNGDGYDDVLVGATYHDDDQTDEGAAFLYLGSASGPAASAAWTTQGDQDYAYLGVSVAAAGDVNGDGYDDVIVGAASYDGVATDDGRALLYLGSASGLSSTAVWTGGCGQAYAYFGGSVAAAGDTDGDGFDDLIVGAAYYDAGETDEGRVFAYFGAADMDGDGMLDAWEANNGFDPSDPSDAFTDTDGDGVTNLWEYWYGTDPNDADTDGDGVSDGLEIAHGYDPLAEDETPGAFYVSAVYGSDTTGYGALLYPWATIQHALGSVTGTAGNPIYIYVSEGTYREAVTMHEHEHLYGGYDSYYWTRDLASGLSVIDGSSAGAKDAAYHVVTGADSSTLDGFVVTGGDASGGATSDQCGGGVYLDGSSPTIRNCTISGNSAEQSGGGIFCGGGSPTIASCVITGNSAESADGGGIACHDGASPTIVNCTVVANTALNGGGVSATSSSPTILNCILWDNGDDLYQCAATYSCIEDGDAGTGNLSDDPLFVSGASGTWTADPTYDSDTGLATLTDSNVRWEVDALAGLLLNPDVSQSRHFAIAGNTETTLTVWGDVSAIVSSGDNYHLHNYRLDSGSPAIDAASGDDDTPTEDRDGNARYDDQQTLDAGVGSPGYVDMGAYERQTDSRGVVVSDVSVTVPEAGTASFGVKLSAEPSESVEVAVTCASGDTDITVQSGSSLTFGSSNWDEYQTVALAAATDADAIDGSTTVRCVASGWITREVTATEGDDDRIVVSDRDSVRVPEGGTSTFQVKLYAQPPDEVTIEVGRAGGDADLAVQSGSTLTFTSADWHTYQEVTIEADQDDDGVNDSAVIRCSAPDWSSKDVTATEQEDDWVILTNRDWMLVGEGSTATFQVRLKVQPSADVTVAVAWASGDADVAVSAGSSLTFTPSNWNTYQTATLTVGQDDDAIDGSATVRCSAPDWTSADVTVTEQDTDKQIVSDGSSVTVAEDGTATFQVKLQGRPSDDVDVAVERISGDADVSVQSGASLTFTPTNWDTYRTVTLRAGGDADVCDGEATIRASATGWQSAYVTATEQDGDTQALEVEPRTVTAPEGGTDTFTVALTHQPCAGVTVTIANVSGDSSLQPQPTILQFTPENYDQAQTMSVLAADDADGIDGTATVRASAAGAASIDVAATELDDDRQIVTDADAVTTAEGGSATFRVRLNAQPAGDVAVSVGRANGDTSVDVQNGAALPFTAANWNVYQTVTVAAAQDDDAADGSATIRCSATGWESKDVAVTEDDDDTQMILPDRDTLTVPEGDSATFQVKLSAQPLESVAVSVTRASGDTDVSVQSGASLTFTPTDWGTYQTVLVAAAQDDDAVDGTATVSCSATGWESRDIAVTEDDDDAQAILTDRDTVTVPEGGSATFQLKLSAEPVADVTVAVDRLSGDDDLRVASKVNLVFSPTDWNTYQSVSLTADQDDDAANGTATIRSAATGWQSKDVTATEADDETQSIVTDRGEVSVPEGGSATFLIRLSAQPGADVTVSVERTEGDDDLTVQAGISLAFSSANWDTYRTVTLAAGDDDDAIHDTATITCTATGWAAAEVTATETDDDSQSILADREAVDVPEGGTATFQVKLAAKPADGVDVTITRASGDESLTVQAGGSLSFTPTNWSTYQTVTLAAAGDEDAIDESARIRSSATGWDSADVVATAVDDETQSILVDQATVTVSEGGSASLQVKLSAEPSADVTVVAGRISGDESIAVAQGSSLVFTSGNWGTYQTVTLSAAADDDAADGSATIRCSATDWESSDVTAVESDDDAQAIVADPDAVTVPEGGTATFRVKLSAEPAAEVTVSVSRSSGDEDIAIEAKASLNFVPADWDVYQTVTVSASHDDDAADGTATIRCAANGWASTDVAATEEDDDAQAIMANREAITVPEGGTTTFQLKLSARPVADVTVSVQRASGDESITVSSGAALAFTTENWSAYQTVTVSAAPDDDASDGDAVLRCSAAGWQSVDIAAAEDDDDVQAVVADRDTFSVPEGGTAIFQIKLSAEPSAEVAVSVERVSGDQNLTVVDPKASRTFSPTNWNTYQAVTVSASEDDDALAGTATIRCSATGWDSKDVAATEEDDETQSIVADTDEVSVPEGGTATFEVKLSARPAGNVTVSVGRVSGDEHIVIESQTSLTFTTTDWNTYQIITLAAVHDDDALDGDATVRCSANGWQSRDVTATEADDDTQQILVDRDTLNVPEGSTAAFGVKLSVRPAQNVTVSIGRTGGDESIGVQTDSLTFTPADWDTYQPATLTAAQDDDALAGVATIRCSAAGWGSAEVTATEEDDDTQTIISDRESLAVSEGGTATFQVKLSARPAEEVTIAVSRAEGDEDLAVQSGETLTFTVTSWGTYQAVTLAAGHDDDALGGRATIRCSASGWQSAEIAATESDDDTQAVLTDRDAVSVAEGGSATFQVKLSARPEGNVTVTVSRASGDEDLSVQSGSDLVFTPTTWDTYVAATLVAAQDDDALDGQATFQCAAPDWQGTEVAVAEADDDTQAIVTDRDSVSVPEGGTATFQVKLSAKPAADLTVSVNWADGDGDITLQAGASLVFTAENWAAYQIVTLAAAQDDDAANGSATVRCTATGWTSKDVTTTEADDESQSIVADRGELGVPEGSTATFQVRLSARPSADVVVSVSREDGDEDLTVQSAATVTFTIADWDRYQAVTLAAEPDDDATDGTATIRCTATGWVSRDVAATEIDDETQSILTDVDGVEVPEGVAGTFQAKLSAKPSGNVTVSVSRVAGDDSIGVQLGATLTFTSSDWSVYQGVGLAASPDDDAIDGTATIRCTATGWESKDVIATEGDDDTQAILTNTGSVALAEGGTATFGVKLAAEPSQNVVVSVTRAEGDEDIAVRSGSALTFTPGDWQTYQSVTLAAAPDDDAVDGVAEIGCHAAGWASSDVAVTEADDDEQAIVTDVDTMTVAEGSATTFQVRLSARPTTDVTVLVSRPSGDEDLIVQSGSALTFTPSNWSAYQTAAVAALQDDDAADGSATISCSASGWQSSDLSVTEADDDTQAIVTDREAVTVLEGGTATFQVKLSARPSGDVAVSVGHLNGDGDIAVESKALLAFTASNWDTYQEARVSAAQDDDAVNGSATIRCAADGWTSGDIVALEADDDAQTIIADQDTIAVPEGDTASFQIRLSARPSENVTVSASRLTGDADLGPTHEAGVTFTSANWSAYQPLTLMAAQDDDAVDDRATIRCAAPDWQSRDIIATEVDDDTQAILTNGDPVAVSEGQAATFEVKLAAKPVGEVTVSVARADGDGDIVVESGSSLVYTTTTWNGYQTVTLEAAHDEDALNGTALIRCHAAGWENRDVIASEVDDDSQAILADRDSLTVPEGGSAAFAVRLSAKPTADVTVQVARATGDEDIAVDTGDTLLFTPADWSAHQTATLAAAQDADAVDGLTTIRCSASDWESRDVIAREADDEIQNIVADRSELTVPETQAAAFQVRLSAQPSAPVTVTVARVSGDEDVTVQSGSSLEFGPANWNLYQTVTLAAGDDDDALDGDASIRCSADGWGSRELSVRETDDDVQSIVTDRDALSVPEGGSATLAVKLSAEPPGSVTVSVSRTDGDPDLEIESKVSLVFSTSTWDAYQTVTITAAQDDDAVDGTATIHCAADGWGSRDVTVTEDDDEVQRIVTDRDALSIPEGGSATLQVRLTAEPSGTVTVATERSSGDTDIAVQLANSLTFTPSSWHTYQTVTLVAAQDDDAVGGNATILCRAAGWQSADVTVTETDDETQSVLTDRGSVTVAEGATATFQAKLSALPAADVTVSSARVGGDESVAVQSGASLVFTPANWGTYQTVALEAAEDDDALDSIATMRCSAPGWESRDVTATESDDDRQTILTDQDRLSIPEGGIAVVQVRLGARPATNVAVSVGRVDGDDDIAMRYGSSLTFTPSNWSRYQSATLAASQDDDAIGGDATIRCSAVGWEDKEVTITEDDDETQRLATDTDFVTVREGDTASLQVRLSAEPSDNVDVSIGRASGDSDVTVYSGASHVFTPANWSTYRTVTLAAAEDDDALDGTAAIRCSAEGWESGTVEVTEDDDDSQDILADRDSARVPEGGEATVQVRLSAAPAATVVVWAGWASGDTDLAAGTVLAFSSADWHVYQTVSVAAAEDEDVTNGSATLSCSAPGWISRYITATEVDDDIVLTVASAGHGTTTPSGTTVVDTDDAMPFPIAAEPDPGYVFSYWTTSFAAAVADRTSASTSVTATGDATVTAYFVPSSEIDVEINGAADVHAHAFGLVMAGETASQDFTIRNAGEAELRVLQAAGLEPPFIVSPVNDGGADDDWLIAAGGTMVLSVTFSPTGAARYEDALLLVSNDPGEAAYEISLTGEGRVSEYYVNDGDTDGDVWCTAAGSPAGDGTSPATPADRIQSIVDAYDLEPGDTVYVDTGQYVLSEQIVFGSQDSGTLEEPVLVLGSPKPSTTRLVASGVGTLISMPGTTGVGLNSLTLDGAGRDVGAIEIADSTGVTIVDCTIDSFGRTGLAVLASSSVSIVGSVVRDCAGGGIWLDDGTDVRVSQNWIYGNGYGALVELGERIEVANNFMFANEEHGIGLRGTGEDVVVTHNTLHANACEVFVEDSSVGVSVTSNILWAEGRGGQCLRVDASSQGGFFSDGNDLHASGKAIAGQWGALTCRTLKLWRKKAGQDADSVSVDPKVRDAKSRTLADRDYHLTKKSRLIDVLDVSFQETDVDGDARPLGKGFEIGADEYLCAEISVKPTKLRFKARIEESQSKTLTITNKGDCALVVSSIASSNSRFIVAPLDLPQVLARGAKVEVEVQFWPGDKRKQKAELTIRSNDPERPEVAVKLTGKGKKK